MLVGELATHRLQQKGLVRINVELITENADIAKPTIKWIARLGFGSTKPGLQDRSLVFTLKHYHLLPENLKRLALPQKRMKALNRKKKFQNQSNPMRCHDSGCLTSIRNNSK